MEYRSITEPIRKVNADANYLEATCTGIDVDRKTITCENVVCEGTTCNIEASSPPCGTGLVGRQALERGWIHFAGCLIYIPAVRVVF